MCGILGIIKNNINQSIFKESLNLLNHRGPDNSNFFIENNIGFGHTRLSIHDLSENGKQPMGNANQSIQIIFNGEIYNFIELKNTLSKRGYKFKTKTDTEVIIAAYQEWGQECVNHFNGMWAFAIYDKPNNIIFISRDRFGIKPLYYYKDNQKFLFSSEIPPILNITKSTKSNKTVLLNYLIYGLEDINKETFFNNIFQLLPGHNIIYNLTNHSMTFKRYYIAKKSEKIKNLPYEDQEELLDKLLTDSLNLRFRSDVPIGSCLSGGIDSSLVCTYAKQQISKNTNSFKCITAKSLDPSNDESNYAKLVTQSLNLTGYISEPSTNNFFSSIQDIIKTVAEPFRSPSLILQNYVYETAKKNNCKVMLDGQGGDEVFLGYERYYSTFLKSIPLIDAIKEFSAISNHSKLNKTSLLKYLIYFSNSKIRTLYSYKKHPYLSNETLNYMNNNPIKKLTHAYKSIDLLQNYELNHQLPHLLKYADRLSMKHSIESRLPLLDYRIVEFALSLKPQQKINNGWTKYPLRKLLSNNLNEKISWRKHKVGFEAPSNIWLNSEKFINLFTENIHQSTLLKNLIKPKYLKNPKLIHDMSNKETKWKLFNITEWEKIFNVTH